MRRRFVPIFFTVDKCYIPYLSVCIASLIDHASPKNEYRIHILYTDIKRYEL